MSPARNAARSRPRIRSIIAVAADAAETAAPIQDDAAPVAATVNQSSGPSASEPLWSSITPTSSSRICEA